MAQTFPVWLYHREHGAKLFTNAIEFAKAGSGWKDSPDRFNEPDEPLSARTIDADVPPSPVVIIADTPQKPIEEFVSEATAAEVPQKPERTLVIPPSAEQSIAQKAKEFKKK